MYIGTKQTLGFELIFGMLWSNKEQGEAFHKRGPASEYWGIICASQVPLILPLNGVVMTSFQEGTHSSSLL